jgi:cell pole-organizing protein PopZ
MTQPAKVQEPSMEEILASIRRIIADDEAKPAAGEKSPSPTVVAKPEKPAAAAPAAKASVMSNIPPSAIPAAQAAAAKAAAASPPAAKTAPAPPPAKPAPAPAPPPAAAPAATVSNSQDDIDAMLAGLDEATSEAEIRPPAPVADVFELTDDMALPDPPKPSFQKVEPQDDLEFAESAAAKKAYRQPGFEPPLFEGAAAPPPKQILSHTTVSAVESAFNSLAHTVLSNNARTLEDLVKEMLRPMLKSWLDDNLPGLVERIVKMEIERVSRGGR